MLNSKSSEPLDFTTEIEIAAPCRDVYAALDLKSPVNRYLRRGMGLTSVSGTSDKYIMVNPALPDVEFTMTEHGAQPGARYELSCAFPAGEPIGILTGDHTSYELIPVGKTHCNLKVQIRFFVIPITEAQRDDEMGMLTVAVHDDIARLKALVEEGSDAAEKAGALDEFFDVLDELTCCQAVADA